MCEFHLLTYIYTHRHDRLQLWYPYMPYKINVYFDGHNIRRTSFRTSSLARQRNKLSHSCIIDRGLLDNQKIPIYIDNSYTMCLLIESVCSLWKLLFPKLVACSNYAFGLQMAAFAQHFQLNEHQAKAPLNFIPLHWSSTFLMWWLFYFQVILYFQLANCLN